MKFIHLSDLHLGKRVNEFSMIEDQKDILAKILTIIREEAPDAVLIAGDIYDKAVPSAEAVSLLDEFMVRLAQIDTQTFIISGNHDSAERLAFGGRLIAERGIHLSPVYNGHVEPITLSDEYGPVDIYMLPFVKPTHVRSFFPEETIESYTDAVRVAVEQMHVKADRRNVLISHQFVTGAERSESEISVGGTDNVDAAVFAPFDYVALGHIHGPQNVGSEHIRYCGTPLKYSFSEAKHHKSVSVIELGEKGSFSLRTVPLVPLHEMVELKGTYDELTRRSFYEHTSYASDYVHITLTDEEDVPNAMAKLRTIYHNLMKLDYDNCRTRHHTEITGTEDVEKKTPMELFRELFELQNGCPMNEEQEAYMQKLIEEVWEAEV